MKDELMRALRPVKRRIRRNRLIRGAAAGLAAGLGAGALVQLASLFMPVEDRALWAGAAAAAGTLAGALGNALRPVADRTAAEAADACGLKERAITALEGNDEPIRQLQRKDACAALAGLDVKQIRAGSMRKYLLAALGCAAVLGILLIPNPQDSAAADRKALRKAVAEGRKAVEQAAEEDAERLPEQQKEELRKIAADLNRELGGSRDAADALVALDRAEQRLEQLRPRTAGDALAQGGAGGAAGEGGAEAGKDGTGTGKADGQNAAGTAGTADSGTAAAPLRIQAAVDALKTAVNPSRQAGNSAQGSNGGNGTGKGQTGAGQGNGSGENNGSPSGGAGGSGPKAGSGAGEGTTNEEQPGGDSGGGGKGNRSPRYKETAYETIYDPEHIDRSRQDVMTEQYRLSDEGAAQAEAGPGRGTLEGDVPWGEVLEEYAETESRAADRENLTTQEKQWVNDYYRLLTEQQ